MKRSAQHALGRAVAKRQCWQQQTEEPASSSAAPLPQHHAMQQNCMPIEQAYCGINKQLASAAVVSRARRTAAIRNSGVSLSGW